MNKMFCLSAEPLTVSTSAIRIVVSWWLALCVCLLNFCVFLYNVVVLTELIFFCSFSE